MLLKFEAYRLAGMARQKLLYHASQTDHDLRSLVLHANLLDNLLIELNGESDTEDVTDRDTLPTLIAYHSNLHRNVQPVILVKKTNANASSDEEDSEDEDSQSSITRKSTPPMLSHDPDTDPDTDSESEYSDSETDQDSSNDFEVHAEPISPTASASSTETQQMKVENENERLSLHRTYPSWRFKAS
jgi:hypothetical protein